MIEAVGEVAKQYQLYLGDCLEVMRDIPDGSVDCVVTDPPYGVQKAAWDTSFPRQWYSEARRVGEMIVIITDSARLKNSIPLVGDDFVDVIAAWNRNGMTYSPIGYGNWLAAVIAKKRPALGQNILQFSIRGDMPAHPCPKPIEYMTRLVNRVTQPGDTVLDPFMGSGTTGVAAIQEGRRFIGIEIDPAYYAIAERRIVDVAAQTRLF